MEPTPSLGNSVLGSKLVPRDLTGVDLALRGDIISYLANRARNANAGFEFREKNAKALMGKISDDDLLRHLVELRYDSLVFLNDGASPGWTSRITGSAIWQRHENELHLVELRKCCISWENYARLAVRSFITLGYLMPDIHRVRITAGANPSMRRIFHEICEGKIKFPFPISASYGNDNAHMGWIHFI